jgi:Oligosaccharyltransferase subunit Ribophorin II
MTYEFASIKVIVNESSPTKPTPPERWESQPEITHTFKQPQKLPNVALSALFALAVAAGIPIFIVLVFIPLFLYELTIVDYWVGECFFFE